MTDLRGWVCRLSVSVLAFAGAICGLYYAFAVIAPSFATQSWSTSTVVYESLMTATGLVAALLALVVLWGAPISTSSIVFSLYLACLALIAADGGRFRVLDATPLASWVSRVSQQRASGLLFAAALACCLAAGLRWSQLFPRRLEREDLHIHTVSRLARAAQGALLHTGGAWIGVGIGGFVLFASSAVLFQPWPNLQLVVTLAGPLTILVLGTLNLRVNYRAGTPAEQRRIYWVLEAGLVASILSFITFGMEIAVHVLGASSRIVVSLHAVLLPLALLSLIALLSVAVLYAGAIDSRLVIRRTVLYGATGLVLTFVFVAIEGLASELIVSRVALPDRAGGWLAGLAVALTFGPVKQWVERRLGRVMDGSSAQEIVSAGTKPTIG